METTKAEIWKAIPGYEGSYEVSDQGRVRSLDRIDNNNHRRQGRILGFRKTNKGYWRTDLSCGGILKRYAVHRIVTAAFLGPCPENKIVNHINGIRTDNRLENLEYVTQGENVRLAFANGDFRRKADGHGENNSGAKLTENNVREIRRLLAEGVSQRKIAAKFNVVPTTITQIKRRRNWAHIE